MEYTTLGRTGLKVSVAGLGCGGASRIGLKTGLTKEQSVALIHRAVDLGVNFFDTAYTYQNETIVGVAMASVPRDLVVLATKYHAGGVSAEEIVEALDNSLRKLGTDYVDIFQLHGVRPKDYDHALNVLVPALLRERERGKLRFVGITESTSDDLGRTVLQRAVADDCWDVVMVAFNMLHQKARDYILPAARERNIGTLIMAPVRSLFCNPAQLVQTMRDLAAQGEIPKELARSDDPLGFLVHEQGAEDITDAAYRFARHEPGVDVVLFGTGNTDHLEANIKSSLRPPLPQADLDRLARLFGHLAGVDLSRPIQRPGVASCLKSTLGRLVGGARARLDVA